MKLQSPFFHIYLKLFMQYSIILQIIKSYKCAKKQAFN